MRSDQPSPACAAGSASDLLREHLPRNSTPQDEEDARQRCAIGESGRPMAFERRRAGFGNRGSIRLHKASSIRRSDMRDRLALGHATVPICQAQYKMHVSYS
jgi:hypothetical protein